MGGLQEDTSLVLAYGSVSPTLEQSIGKDCVIMDSMHVPCRNLGPSAAIRNDDKVVVLLYILLRELVGRLGLVASFNT